MGILWGFWIFEERVRRGLEVGSWWKEMNCYLEDIGGNLKIEYCMGVWEILVIIGEKVVIILVVGGRGNSSFG